MSTVIYIRHGKKAYKNGKSPLGFPEHDSPLDPEHYSLIEDISKKLVDNYGEPDLIISSPMKRTRDTCDILKKTLKNNPPLVIDSDITEYLGFQKPIGEEACVYPESKITGKTQLLGMETKNDLRERCETHLQNLLSSDENEVIWVVSHGFCITTIYNLLTKFSYGKIHDLSGFVWDRKNNVFMKI